MTQSVSLYHKFHNEDYLSKTENRSLFIFCCLKHSINYCDQKNLCEVHRQKNNKISYQGILREGLRLK